MKKLNESPDEVWGLDPKYDYYKKIAKWDDPATYAFGIIDDEMYVNTKSGGTHNSAAPAQLVTDLINKTEQTLITSLFV